MFFLLRLATRRPDRMPRSWHDFLAALTPKHDRKAGCPGLRTIALLGGLGKRHFGKRWLAGRTSSMRDVAFGCARKRSREIATLAQVALGQRLRFSKISHGTVF